MFPAVPDGAIRRGRKNLGWILFAYLELQRSQARSGGGGGGGHRGGDELERVGVT